MVLIFLLTVWISTDSHLNIVPPPQSIINVAELTLRRGATKMVMPEYPSESVKNHSTGIAVAQIEINADGEVDKLEVLEAPDLPIKNEVSGAVKQWRFQPQTIHGSPVRIRGKLTFYFVFDEEGRATVKNPKQPEPPPKK